jgi:peptidoglycan/LPS O-acetylase OafA/YrhL
VRSGEIKALTGLRIVAAVWVVLFHFRPLLRDAAPGFLDALTPVLNCGAQGVDLFFILSGFVLTWNYLDRMGGSWSTRATMHFLWLRLARVWPVYLVTLHLAALWVIFTLHVGHVPSQEIYRFTAISYVRQVLLVQLWFQPFFDDSSWDGPAWSISAEWLAYILFGLLVLVIFRMARATRARNLELVAAHRHAVHRRSAGRCRGQQAAADRSRPSRRRLCLLTADRRRRSLSVLVRRAPAARCI